MVPSLRAWLACAVLFSAAQARAEPPDDANASSEDDVGFADAEGADAAGFETSQPSAATPTATPSAWTVSATYRTQAAIRLESDQPSRLAKLRQVFEAKLEWHTDLGASWELRAVASGRTEADFAVLANLAKYAQPDVDVYGWQLLPRESYLALASRHLELRVGEQILNFGQGEVLSAVDVVNPRDLREPLLADLSELRMPVLMTRVLATVDTIRAEVAVVHEPYFGLLPPPRSELSAFRRLITETLPPLAMRTLTFEHFPDRDIRDFGSTQAHARLGWSGPSIDLTLSASSVLDPFGVPALPTLEALAAPVIVLPIQHPRFTMLGHTGVLTVGAFSFRWEAAFDISRPIALRDASMPFLGLSSVRRSGLRGLAGITYVPSASTNVGLEVMQGYVFDNPARAPGTVETLLPLEAPQFALRFSQRFARDRANLSLLLLRIGATTLNAWAARIELSYALFDPLELTVGCVTYHPTNNFGVLYGLDNQDRVFLNLRWDLQS